MRLIEISRSSVDTHLDKTNRHKVEGDPITRIYALIRELASNTASPSEGAKEVPMESIRELVTARGFTADQLQECIAEFDQCNIWSVSGAVLKIYN